MENCAIAYEGDRIKGLGSDEWCHKGKYELLAQSIFGLILVGTAEPFVSFIPKSNPHDVERIPLPEGFTNTKVRNSLVTKDGLLCIMHFRLEAEDLDKDNMIRLRFNNEGKYTGMETFRFLLTLDAQWPYLHFVYDEKGDIVYSVSCNKSEIYIFNYSCGALSHAHTVGLPPGDSTQITAVNVTPKIVDDAIIIWYATHDPNTKTYNINDSLTERTLDHAKLPIANLIDTQKSLLTRSSGDIELGFSDKLNFQWSDDGDYCLLMSHCFVDHENGSYGGTTKLYILSGDGIKKQRVQTDSEVQCAAWRPNSHEFIYIDGRSYNRIIHSYAEISARNAYRSVVLHEFPKGYRNTICWNAQGNAVALGGFGQMAGDISIWFINEKGEWVPVAEWRESCAVKLAWAPDGLTMVIGSTFPRMKVDNFIKVFSNNGSLLSSTSSDLLKDVFFGVSKTVYPAPGLPSKNIEIVSNVNKPYRPPGFTMDEDLPVLNGLRDMIMTDEMAKDLRAKAVKAKKIKKVTPKEMKCYTEPWRPKRSENPIQARPAAKAPPSKENAAFDEESSTKEQRPSKQVIDCASDNLLNGQQLPAISTPSILQPAPPPAGPGPQRPGQTAPQPNLQQAAAVQPAIPAIAPQQARVNNAPVSASHSGSPPETVTQKSGNPASAPNMYNEYEYNIMKRAGSDQMMRNLGMSMGNHTYEEARMYQMQMMNRQQQAYMQQQRRGGHATPVVNLKKEDVDRFYSHGVGQNISNYEPLKIKLEDVDCVLSVTDPLSQHMWQYVDTGQRIQGCFSSDQMRLWYDRGFLSDNLEVRCMPHHKFQKLRPLFCGHKPFEYNITAPLVIQLARNEVMDNQKYSSAWM